VQGRRHAHVCLTGLQQVAAVAKTYDRSQESPPNWRTEILHGGCRRARPRKLGPSDLPRSGRLNRLHFVGQERNRRRVGLLESCGMFNDPNWGHAEASDFGIASGFCRTKMFGVNATSGGLLSCLPPKASKGKPMMFSHGWGGSG